MGATEPRYWIIDHAYAGEPNRIAEAARAAQMPLVGLVDEEEGGVIGYLHPEFADGVVNSLNGAARAGVPEDFAAMSSVADPGESFLATGEDGEWAVWRLLDGDDLALAREIGHISERVVACVLLGGGDRGDPFNPRGIGEPPYAMTDPAEMRQSKRTRWQRLGRI